MSSFVVRYFKYYCFHSVKATKEMIDNRRKQFVDLFIRHDISSKSIYMSARNEIRSLLI